MFIILANKIHCYHLEIRKCCFCETEASILLPVGFAVHTLSIFLTFFSFMFFSVLLIRNNRDLSICTSGLAGGEKPALLGQALAAHNKSIHTSNERRREREA